MAAKTSFDEQVSRIALDRIKGEAKAVAGMRGLPPELRYATPDEELLLYYTWDAAVDPHAVMMERLQKHIGAGMPPDAALAEAILEASAAGYVNKLKMGQADGRLDLASQVKYHEQMAAKYPRFLELKAQQMGEPPPDVLQEPTTPPAPPSDGGASVSTPAPEVTDGLS